MILHNISQLINEAEFDVKNYGYRGECYLEVESFFPDKHNPSHHKKDCNKLNSS